MRKFLIFILGLIVSFPVYSPVKKEVNLVNFHSSYEYRDFSNKFEKIDFLNLPKDLEEKIKDFLDKIPDNHYQTLRKVKGEKGKDQSRGLASFRSMYLGLDVIPNDKELERVFYHELGHIVDLGMLIPEEPSSSSDFKDGSFNFDKNDPSLEFYSLCFQDSYTLNGNCQEKDFVSEYAQTDVFEDFAETYLLYLKNNDTFLEMTKNSEILKKKYNFLQEKVFKNFTPENNLYPNFNKEKRDWDLTKQY
jgi:hypothetical protein